MTIRKEWALAATLIWTNLVAFGQTSTPEVARAIAARNAGDYETSISTLRDVLAASPDNTEYKLLLAETLAWAKDFASAESLYREICANRPDSRPARLGLARVLMWQGRYEDASHEFGTLLARNPADADALEGHATTAYWSGDYRTAAREFEHVLSIDPHREAAARSLREIQLSARPSQRLDIGALDDDQPYRALRTAISATVASDPLTRWSGTAGNHRLDSEVYGRASAPFASIGNETVFPSLRLTLSADGEIMRYPDGVTRPNGAFAVRRDLGHSLGLSLRAEKSALFATASGIETHPSLTTYAVGLNRQSDKGWTAAAEASALRYFDGNQGVGAWAWALAPVVSRSAFRLSLGAAGSYRDSDESRFHFSAVSSQRTGAIFAYTYRGEYAPYWAPQNLREWRAIVVAQTTLASTTLTLHADGGVGHDRATAFGPSSGPDPIPPSIYEFNFDRKFHPARVELSASLPLGGGFTAKGAFEISRTVYYRSKTFHASVVRRH